MFDRPKDAFWNVTWSAAVIGIRIGKRTLREIEYRHDRLKRGLQKP